MPGVVTISSKLDLFFVNTLGLPHNSGMIFHFILMVILFVVAVKTTFSSTDKVKNASFSFGAMLLTGIWVISDSGFLNLLVLASIVVFIWFIADRNRVVLNTVLTANIDDNDRLFSQCNNCDKGAANPLLNETSLRILSVCFS
jgi:hypothetical protein